MYGPQPDGKGEVRAKHSRRRGCRSSQQSQGGWSRGSDQRGGRDPALSAPYSPHLNPIEKLFAKLKALLRKAPKHTLDAFWKEIGKLLDTILPDECANYFASSGYVYTYYSEH